MVLLNEAHTLRIDVKDRSTSRALLVHITHSLRCRAIHIPSEDSMLEELAVSHALLEFVSRNKVVGLAIHLARTYVAGGVAHTESK